MGTEERAHTNRGVILNRQQPTATTRASTVVDPGTDHWLDDHALHGHPPLLPLSSLVQQLALAAQNRAPNQLVLGLRRVTMVRWVPLQGPLVLQVVQRHTRRADTGWVRLAVLASVQDERSSGWRGRRTVAEGLVRTGERYARPGGPLPALAESTHLDDALIYHSAPRFYGPAFQVAHDLDVGPTGYRARLDAGGGDLPQGLFNQALVDGCSHGAVSAVLAGMYPGLPHGLYLPWAFDWATFHGPSPRQGEVRCEARAAGLAGPNAACPTLRVQLSTADRVWAEMKLILRRF